MESGSKPSNGGTVGINRVSFTDSKGNKMTEEDFKKQFAKAVTKAAQPMVQTQVKPSNKQTPEFR